MLWYAMAISVAALTPWPLTRPWGLVTRSAASSLCRTRITAHGSPVLYQTLEGAEWRKLIYKVDKGLL